MYNENNIKIKTKQTVNKPWILFYNNYVYLRLGVCMYMYMYIYIYIYVCVLAVYNKAQAQRISNREFKLWTFLQGTESRVATFLAETYIMSH